MSENIDNGPAAEKSIPSEDIASEAENPMFEKTGKWFVLKHTFEDISEYEDQADGYSNSEEHFGINWYMSIHHEKGHLVYCIWCNIDKANGLWSVEADIEVKVMSKDGNPDIRKSFQIFKQDEIDEGLDWCEWNKFMKWDDLEKKHFIDDSLTFEVSFKIRKMIGIYKDNLRNFDAPECSDTVLVVNNQKFYVSKLTLAAHSSYFKTMFLGIFDDSKKSEMSLTGIDANDFQKYLEVLYGEYAIDEHTVEGILMIADMYNTGIAIRKCEEFFLKESTKKLQKIIEMAVRYRLENLKKKCLSEINTPKDNRAVLPTNTRDMNSSTMANLIEKLLATS